MNKLFDSLRAVDAAKLQREKIYCLDCDTLLEIIAGESPDGDYNHARDWEPFMRIADSGEVQHVRICGRCLADIEVIESMRTEYTLYECGVCGGYHPMSARDNQIVNDGVVERHMVWDCGNDAYRFDSVDEYAELSGVNAGDVNVVTWEDICAMSLPFDDVSADS